MRSRHLYKYRGATGATGRATGHAAALRGPDRSRSAIARRFARFADQEGVPYIDTAPFLRWDASLPDAGTSTRSARLGMVRLFAQWLSGIDPAHEVPPRGLLPGRLHRSRPYIYRDAEIALI